MEARKLTVLSILIGILVGVIGTFIAGFVLAVAIPRAYFTWFQEHLSFGVGFFILNVVEQVLSFGIIAAVAGYIIGRISLQKWPIYSGVGYISAALYIIVGNALIYNVPVLNPFVILGNLDYAVHIIMLPACFFLFAFLAVKRHNNLRQQDTEPAPL